MRKKGTMNKVYSAEFKIMGLETMRENHWGYSETALHFEISKIANNGKNAVKRWERIYLDEGAAGLMQERRGRSSKLDGIDRGRPSKLKPEVEEDLIAENQLLIMENAYLKKLHALALSKKKSRSKTKPK